MSTPQQAVGIVGAGVMGIGIAQVAALAGHPVRLLDARDGAAAAALERLAQTLAGLVGKGRLSDAQCQSALQRLQPVDRLAELADCDLVVEAIVERAEPKQALLRELDALLPPAALLASNTSSLSITLLANGLRHPGRLVGMHFFNPVPLMQLVEVVAGAETDEGALVAVERLAQAWGKVPVRAASTPGFIVNRIARPYYAEALALLQEQAGPPADLDSALRAAGFRMGPCELMDLIGHDTNSLVTRSVWEANFGDRRYQPSLVQQALVDGGRLGRKTGRGFFEGPAPRRAPVPRPASPPPICLVGQGPNVDRLAARLPGVARQAADWNGLRSEGFELGFTDGRCAYETGRALMDWLAHDSADALAVTHDVPACTRCRCATCRAWWWRARWPCWSTRPATRCGRASAPRSGPTRPCDWASTTRSAPSRGARSSALDPSAPCWTRCGRTAVVSATASAHRCAGPRSKAGSGNALKR